MTTNGASAGPPGELRRVFPRFAVGATLGSARRSRWLLNAALRMEGGAFRSATARDVMRLRFGVAIGAYSYGECFVSGSFQPGTVIGRYVSVAEGVRWLGRNHPMERLSMHPYFYNSELGVVSRDSIPFAGAVVESDAWLGLRAILTPGCRRVGIGAVVAAGAVVTHDVPDFAVVAGTPARVMRYRFPEDVQDAVRRSRWWEMSVADVARHADVLGVPLSAELLRHPLLAARS